MKKWILKAVVQKCISFLPNRNQINLFFQKRVTGGVFLSEEYFEDRLIHASNHIKWLKKNRSDLGNVVSFELGTGWYPVVPLSLFLTGVGKIHGSDLNEWLKPQGIKDALAFFLRYEKEGKLEGYFDVLPERLSILMEMKERLEKEDLSREEILDKFNMEYLLGDLTRSSSMKERGINFYHSNNTLEHIYPNVIKGIFNNFSAWAGAGRLDSHFIDMSDHFAHFDKSITIYNFLKYSDGMWDFIDNKIQPQNRYRFSEYKALYHEIGMPITEYDFRKGSQEDLAKIKTAPKYIDFTKEDLAISHCHLYSKF